jgi:hypothetical protein
MSPYRRMRDPTENKDVFPMMAFHAERSPDWQRVAEDVYAQIKRRRDGMRLLSLTRDHIRPPEIPRAFGCCWARPRMWEQYGDVHRGACLVFSRDRLLAVLKAEMHLQGVGYMDEVEYTPAGFAGSRARTITDDRVLDDHQRRAAVTQHLDGHVKDFFFLKMDDWATEYEFRALLLAPKDEFAFVSYGEALRAAIVGDLFPESGLPEVHRACAAAGVELRRLIWDNGRPVAIRDT